MENKPITKIRISSKTGEPVLSPATGKPMKAFIDLNKKHDQKQLDFVFNQATSWLDWQIKCALASDQRATTIAAIFSALAVAVFSFLGFALQNHYYGFINIGIGACGISMLIGSWCCISAARVTKFYYPGNTPELWQDSINNDISLEKDLIYEIENYQHRIDLNHDIAAQNGEILNWGIKIAFLSPLVGLTLGLIYWLIALVL
jgi:hypothetical protein